MYGGDGNLTAFSSASAGKGKRAIFNYCLGFLFTFTLRFFSYPPTGICLILKERTDAAQKSCEKLTGVILFQLSTFHPSVTSLDLSTVTYRDTVSYLTPL